MICNKCEVIPLEIIVRIYIEIRTSLDNIMLVRNY